MPCGVHAAAIHVTAREKSKIPLSVGSHVGSSAFHTSTKIVSRAKLLLAVIYINDARERAPSVHTKHTRGLLQPKNELCNMVRI